MHSLDIELVEMTLDVMKYAINRISNTSPELGKPKKEEELKALVGETITEEGIGGEKAFELFRDILVKAAVPVDHPRHLAFVPAAPTRAATLFDLITSASSIHGAYWMTGAGGIYCENRAMEWLVKLTDLPEGSFGVFTSGGTAANLSAMIAAREYWRNLDDHNKALKGLIITSEGAHSSIKSMAQVIDADMILVEDNDEKKMTGDCLQQKINSLSDIDRKRLFAVVGTGGTTNAGIVDDLKGVADICKKEKIWFHVDAAYGGAALAAPSVRHLFKGINQADSITIDPHKWMFSPYDCGAVIYKNMELAAKAHSQKGAYLDIFKDEGAQGFNPADYQIQLTRRLRGLPLWYSIATHGTKKYTEAIEQGIDLAHQAADKIKAHPKLNLIREPGLSCVLFERKEWEAQDYINWTYDNHQSGFALVTPTKWKIDGKMKTISRFCFINPDTTEKDIDDILATLN